MSAVPRVSCLEENADPTLKVERDGHRPDHCFCNRRAQAQPFLERLEQRAGVSHIVALRIPYRRRVANSG